MATNFHKITSATIYTDGSCHTQQRVGTWVAILLIGGNRLLLSGSATDTTHNSMELTAVIKALEYLRVNYPDITTLTICSDSQYVIGLTARAARLTSMGFTTKKGKELPNAGLVKELLDHCRSFTVGFIKIAAHQKQTEQTNYNIEADYLARKLLREKILSGDRLTVRPSAGGSGAIPPAAGPPDKNTSR